MGEFAELGHIWGAYGERGFESILGVGEHLGELARLQISKSIETDQLVGNKLGSMVWKIFWEHMDN